MSRKLMRVRLLSLVLITMMLVGYIPQAAWAGQVLKQEEPLFRDPLAKYDIEPVYIIYDPSHELMKAIAEDVHEVLDFRLEQIRMVPITDWRSLETTLMDEPWIAIYALQSHHEGVQFAE
ncbi:MAG: hypothetical protein ACFFER_19330, partial [Candidatus Thorarchaeota archaeon]